MKNVFITGGSRGIGAACVKIFSEKGYKVAFTYKESKKAAIELSEKWGAIALQCDVSDKLQVEKAYIDGKILLGIQGFDVVIGNAGISLKGLFTETSYEDWDNINAVNLGGVFNLIKTSLPFMISSKKGSIILISSIWGQVGGSCEVAYSATKGGIIAMTKALAKEVAPSNVRVNCIAPGAIDTSMNENLCEEEKNALKDNIPLGRMGEGDEVAKTIEFLASDQGSYITGQVIGVNGGMVI